MTSLRRAPAILAQILLTASIVASLPVPGTPARPVAAEAAEPDFPITMSGYHNLLEMTAAIGQAAADYPSIVRVSSIGKSYQGRDIWIAKVTDRPDVEENEPEVLIDTLHHAREHLGTEQALAVLRWLTTGYNHDATITDLVNTRVVWIIFALNPDGLRYDLTGSPFWGWRKNRQPNAGSTAVGTDLNRNYGYHWGCCGGSSGNPASITYRGQAAFSAPETQALRDFVRSRVIGGVQRIRTHVTLHSNGRKVLWPYSWTRTDVPADMTALDHSALVAMGRGMAALNGYTPEQSSDLYISDGNQIDWMYGVYRIFSYTFELYPSDTGTVSGDFYPDDSHIAAETERNRGALLRLISRAWCPYTDLGASYVRADCGPMFDDLEVARGWTVNPGGTDTASAGSWAAGIPAATRDAGGVKQLATASSGRREFATGLAAGASANANDLDGGTTTIRSRPVRLPGNPAAVGPLTFRYVFAHDARSSTADSLQVLVEGADGSRTAVFTVKGSAANLNAGWQQGSASLAAWAGQWIRVVVTATDGGGDSLVEAALDDVRIRRP